MDLNREDVCGLWDIAPIREGLQSGHRDVVDTLVRVKGQPFQGAALCIPVQPRRQGVLPSFGDLPNKNKHTNKKAFRSITLGQVLSAVVLNFKD